MCPVYHLQRNFVFDCDLLIATIEQHKSGSSNATKAPSYGYGNSYASSYGGGYRGRGRGRGGVVGGTGPHKQYVRPGLATSSSSSTGGGAKGKENTIDPSSSSIGAPKGVDGPSQSGEGSTSVVGGRKEVVIGGVAFEASKRSLVRKDREFLSLNLSFSTSKFGQWTYHYFCSGKAETEDR